jgi:hypothetical protein
VVVVVVVVEMMMMLLLLLMMMMMMIWIVGGVRTRCIFIIIIIMIGTVTRHCTNNVRWITMTVTTVIIGICMTILTSTNGCKRQRLITRRATTTEFGG